MSWEDINKEPVQEPLAEEATNHFCRLCYEVFELNPLGKALFKMLEDHLETPVAPPDKEAAWAYFREGQNNIIRQFKRAIVYHTKRMEKK